MGQTKYAFPTSAPSVNKPFVTDRAVVAGDTVYHLDCHQPTASARTIQCGPKERYALSEDLARIRHSCDPNVAFDLSSADRREWHVRAVKDIEVGTPLTYFYPSTEWTMDAPFECTCGARTCLGTIYGAKQLEREALMRRPHLNPWILFDEQRHAGSNSKCVACGEGARIRGRWACACSRL
ncbi:hypothetical protein FIBSPDRAFT_1040670 [Athelia psychrophila]|uniref:Post-SET domain-containing protein n=1 Tax=Athelia psychrophila TaxID=1759441 RepID=A0A166Q0M0_9AGAM|nr:hypothetical protein FIBSPDRAFT_1040670 [Fibularhizoctonia sp. CBS 109695]